MNIPPLLLAAALLLWGLCADRPVVALLLALPLELSRVVHWRWQLGDRDFDRVTDVTAIGFVLVGIYAFDQYAFHGVYRLIEWLPMLLYALVLVQVFSSRQRIAYRSLFHSVRRAHRRGLVSADAGIDFRLPYLGCCLAAATVNTEARIPVFWGLLAVLAWLLWSNRSRRYGARAWMVAFSMFVVLGVAADAGVIGLRKALEPAVVRWFQDRIWSHRDPFRAYTSIGQIGQQKLSDRMVLRVTPEPGTGYVPELLRESAYQTFSKNMWLAGNANFEALTPDLDGTVWAFREPEPGAQVRRVAIGAYLPRGRGMLPLPVGSTALTELPAEEVERNPLGAIRVVKGPDFAEYTATFTPSQSYEAPPTESDLRVPSDLATLMQQVVQGLGVEHLAPREAIARLDQWFGRDFGYSLVQRRTTAVSRPLHDFLLDTREGHCEYFATATVLLLRSLGIPARYASGYSVQEWSETEQRYLVRRRHSHAWALAWLDGSWVDVDTTPAVWVLADAEHASVLEPLYDFVSWAWYLFSRWRWAGVDEDADNTALLWMVLPLALFLAWRLRRSERVRHQAVRTQAGNRPALAGADSELFLVEEALRRDGEVRPQGVSTARWLAAMEREQRLVGAGVLREEVLPLHYRYRFDPAGLSGTEREQLRERAADWLRRHRAGGAG